MGRHKDPDYANKWYHKNKERLKSKPGRKEAKKISDRKYYLKNKEKLKAKAKEYVSKNRAKVLQRKKDYYFKNRNYFLKSKKLLRATPEYKQYVKEYRKKNRDRIIELQKITSERSIRKMVDSISDSYVVGQILCSPLNTLTRAEIKANKSLIDIKRWQILIGRLKRKISQLKK